MAFLDSYNLSNAPTFRARIEAAIVAAAIQINGEAPSNPVNETKDLKRKTLAIAIINNTSGYVPIFSRLVAANPTISAAYAATPNQSVIPDGDIEFTLASVFDDAAGV